MLIRIKNTTFGLVINGIVKPKTPSDPPFDVDDELGARLVRDGVAEIIGNTMDCDTNTIESGDDEGADGDFGIPKYDAKTSKEDLQSIAKEYGVEIADDATKQDIIDALDDFFADAMPESEN